MQRHRLLGTGLALGLALALAAPANANVLTFTIDPAKSWLEVATAQSGVRLTVPGPFVNRFVATAAQSGAGVAGGMLPGGLASDGTRTSLSGVIVAKVRPQDFSIVTSQTLVTLGTSGTFRPGPAANRATPAPANLAVHLEDALLGVGADVALRQAKFSMFGSNLALTPDTPGVFAFTPSFSLTPAWVDGAYDSTLNSVGSTLAAANIQPFSSNDASGNFEQLANGGIRLTMPITLQAQPFAITLAGVPLPANLEVRVTGQIVATVPEAAPALSALAALLALLFVRDHRRRSRRGAFATIAALLLIGSACPSEPGFQTDTSGEDAASAGVDLDIGNGALSGSDDDTASPDAFAFVDLDGSVGGAEASGNCTAERVSRLFVESDVFYFQVRCDVLYDGGDLSFTYGGHVDGDADYTIQVPTGEADPDAIPFVLVVQSFEPDPNDVADAEATVTCDGQAPTALAPNDVTLVPVDPTPGFGTERSGHCAVALALSGSRANAATTSFQLIAELHFPRVGAQATPASCAAQDPANPYPQTDGSCGDGIATSCRHSSHCAPDNFCVNSLCVDGTLDAFCEADFQCDAGLICTFGKCEPPAATCDPVEQTGCGQDEKCDGLFGTAPGGAQGRLTRCTANGDVAKGGTCQPLTLPSCQRGLTCDGFVCRTWCRTADDCDAGEACDVSTTDLPLDPAGDLAEGDGGRCRPAETCLGCR